MRNSLALAASAVTVLVDVLVQVRSIYEPTHSAAEMTKHAAVQQRQEFHVLLNTRRLGPVVGQLENGVI